MPTPTLYADGLERLARAGIVGLGGAAYPTAAKLESGVDPHTLIVNGAECEPYISCDDMLMREEANGIVDGAEILRRITGASECLIAIERDKPLAIEAIEAAVAAAGLDIRIAELASIYPAGGERQLIELLAGIQVPSSRYPSELGFLCQNVGTAYAVHRLFRRREPLLSRIVTVTGDGVAEPRNIEAPIGTPIADLIEAAGGYRGRAAKLIHGGNMMGYTLADDALPVTKATNCIIVAGADATAESRTEWPCIRCGECATACPAALQPQDLLAAARQTDGARLHALALEECIECGCCDIVCPSHIPLTAAFRGAKADLKHHLEQLDASARAEQRYRRREARLKAAARTAQRQQESLKHLLEDDRNRAAAIEAAVARAKNRKLEPKPTTAETREDDA